MNVKVIGTIGILDKLVNEKYIDRNEYIFCLKSLLKHNGIEVRLPIGEINKRLEASINTPILTLTCDLLVGPKI